MENELTIADMSVEQKIMNAVHLLTQSAGFMGSAGFTKTGSQMLEFALNIATLMEKEMAVLEQFNNKLTDNEFDDILANILSVEIEAPNVGK